MPLRYRPKNIVNKTDRGNRHIGKMSKIVGNKMYRATTKKGQEKYKVIELQKKLMADTPILRKNSSENETAKEILNIIGASCILDSNINRVDYSLIDDQLDKELILNPNKVDFKDLKILKKGKITFDKILRETNDPFYTLDEQISQNYIQQNEKILQQEEMNFDFTAIVGDISSMNAYNKQSPTIRSLKDIK
tara:strand:+ start:71 stop:646 length:576 start_codon:yes stop_codon:yes gene_type:complete